MSSMMSGMMGGGGGGMGAGLMNGGGAMGALSNMGQVAGQINRNSASAQGGGIGASSALGPNGQPADPTAAALKSLLDKYLPKTVAPTARVNDTSISKGLD